MTNELMKSGQSDAGLLARAAAVTPGASQTRSKAPGNVGPRDAGSGYPLFATHGEGAYVYDANGKRYLDCFGANAAIPLGYGRDEVVRAVFAAVSAGPLLSLPSPVEVEVSERFLSVCAPWATHVRWLRSGSEATHAAYRIAKRATGRDVVLVGDWCYDSQTEVLTASGWKLFADVAVGELLATLNTDADTLVFQPALEINAQPYSGDMVKFSGRGLDLVVSPNHRVLRAFPDRAGVVHWGFSRASDLLARKKRAVMKRAAGNWLGDDARTVTLASARNTATRRGVGHATKGIVEFDATLFAEFLGYYISEGFRAKKKRAAYEIVVCQNKGATYDRIADVVSGLGFKPNRGQRRISFASKELWLWLGAVGDGAPCKRIPRQVMAWSAARLGVLLGAMIAGDGSVGKNGHRVYYTSSRQLADDVQEVALRCGSAATIRKVRQSAKTSIGGRATKGPGVGFIHHVSLCERRTTTSVDGPEAVPYEGMIYCARVQNGTLYVRRNGKPVWSGNSYHGWHEWCGSRRGDKVVEYGHCADLDQLPDPERIAAVFIEPHRWDPVSEAWLRSVRAFCDSVGALMVMDEMVYGLRWAKGGGTALYGVQPDLACFGKALGNGVPVSCVCGTKEAMSETVDAGVSGTYGGDLIGLMAADAVLRIHQREDVIRTLWANGEATWDAFAEIAPPGAVLEGCHVHWRLKVPGDDQALLDRLAAKAGVLVHRASNDASATLLDGALLLAAKAGVLVHRASNNASAAMTRDEAAMAGRVLGKAVERAVMESNGELAAETGMGWWR